MIAPTFCMLIALGTALAAEPEPAKREDFILPNREAFLQKLDLGRAELAAVKAALDRRDIAAAGRAYVAHFRNRDISLALFEPWDTRTPDPSYDTKYADDCLAGRLKV